MIIFIGEYLKKSFVLAIIALIVGLLFFSGCDKLNNYLPSFELQQSNESGYKTAVEEAPGIFSPLPQPEPDPGLPPVGPLYPPPGPPPGPPPFGPPGGLPLPPPPPPPGDDDGPNRRAIVLIPPCARPVLTDTFMAANKYACKDGNTTSGDGCSDICIKEFCGNGYVEPEHGEECDGGLGFNTAQAPNCDKFCRLRICGNCRVELEGTGTNEPAEECDLGERNGGCSGCTTDCMLVTEQCVNTSECTCTTLQKN